VCIIGLEASETQLQSIGEKLENNSEFLSVSADNNPLILTSNNNEPLVTDGYFTTDGSQLSGWAASACSKKTSPPKTSQSTSASTSPPSPPRGDVPTEESEAGRYEAPASYASESAIGQGQAQPLHHTTESESTRHCEELRRTKQSNLASPAVEEPLTTEQGVKRQHGCLLTWLIIAIILNSIFAVMAADELLFRFSFSTKLLECILHVLIVLFAILIFYWKRIGFWGIVAACVAGIIMNLNMGVGIQSFTGIISIMVLYAVLQIKKDGVSGWKNLT
jgi:hypothetical protein